MINLPAKSGQNPQIDPKATQATLQGLGKAACEMGKAEAEGQSSVYVQGLKNIGEAIKGAESPDERREYVQATERITAASADASEKRTWLNHLNIRNLSVASIVTGSVVGVAWLAKRLR